LNGSEATDAILDWVRQLLASQPFLQPHLTLPMADISISLHVSIDMYVGGTVPVASPPENVLIAGSLDLSNRISGDIPASGSMVHEERDLSARVNAAPIPGGAPPDQIRDRHGLPVSRPGYGPRDTGSHMFLADIAERTDAARDRAPLPVEESNANVRQGIVADGYTFSPSTEGAVSVSQPSATEQSIPLDRGAIDIDLSGKGRMHQGDQVITAGSHIASKKQLGDQAGREYGSVGATYDAGPAGLSRPGKGGGLYSDGRTRISFGNDRR